MKNNIDNIQKEISQLFCEYNIPVFTKNLPMKNLQEWSKKVAFHYKLDEDCIEHTVSELFWTMAHVQLSLGHALVAMQECEFIDGTKGIALSPNDIPNPTMSELYFSYYMSNVYESLYRCWERINKVILYVCFPCISEKEMRHKYLYNTIKDLKKSSKYVNNPYFMELESAAEHREEVSYVRNGISHSL